MALGLRTNALPPVAIDFGTAVMKVLQLGAGEPPTLTAAATLRTPEELIDRPAERLAYQAAALAELMRNAGIRNKRAVCSIPSDQAFVQHLQVQRVEGVSLSAAVRDQVAGVLKCDPAMLVLRHVEVGEVARGGKKMIEVIAMAMSREVVVAHMRALRNCRLDPVGVHCEHAAAAYAFESITRRKEDDQLTTLYVDLGYSTSKVQIAHGTVMKLAKTIHIGTRHLNPRSVPAAADSASAQAGAASRHEVGDALRQVGEQVAAAASAAAGALRSLGDMVQHLAQSNKPAAVALEEERRVGTVAPGLCDITEGGDEAGSRVPRALDELTDEIGMCIRYHQAIFRERRINRAIFFGGGATETGACRHIARVLHLPAQMADPLSRLARDEKTVLLGVDPAQPQPGWTCAVGMSQAPTEA